MIPNGKGKRGKIEELVSYSEEETEEQIFVNPKTRRRASMIMIFKCIHIHNGITTPFSEDTMVSF